MAKAYSIIWGGHAEGFAKSLVSYLQTMWSAHELHGTTVLDLGCGTGHLARYLADRGFVVTGLDRSEPMLAQAVADSADQLAGGCVRFIPGDMAEFDVGAGRFDVATCSYHAINHLADETALRSCFASIAAALRPRGVLAFDFRTARGLEDWNRIKVTDRQEYAVISRGFLNRANGRAWKALSGFVRLESGLYERFEELLDNTVFGVSAVLACLDDAGFARASVVSPADFASEIADPEAEDRVAFVATPR